MFDNSMFNDCYNKEDSSDIAELGSAKLYLNPSNWWQDSDRVYHPIDGSDDDEEVQLTPHCLPSLPHSKWTQFISTSWSCQSIFASSRPLLNNSCLMKTEGVFFRRMIPLIGTIPSLD